MTFPEAAAPFPDHVNRIYGMCTLIFLVFMVWGGIGCVTRLGIFFAMVVTTTLVMFYTGIASAEPTDDGMVTGMNFETLGRNLLPNWSEGYSFGTVMATFFPCFTGILSGANRADVLKDPPRDLKKGTYSAITFS